MLIKITFTLLLILIALPTKAEETITEEPVSHAEHVLMSHLMSLQAGLAYDEHCNQSDPEERLDFEEPENANLYGSLQVITQRLDEEMNVNNEDQTPDQSIEKYLRLTSGTREKILESYKIYNCDNQNGRNGEQSFNLYFNTHPSQIYMMIDEQIKNDNKADKPE